MRSARMKTVAGAALGVVLLVALALFGGGWYYSDQIKAGALEVDRSDDVFDLEVVAIGEDQVTLGVTPETDLDGDWSQDGLWGLESGDGYNQVGAIIALSDEQVVREYTPLAGELSVGDTARLDSFAWPEDPSRAHGIPFDEVVYRSPLGDFPAWFVEGQKGTWAIFVHGKGATRREALRMLPAVTGMGLPSLMITYRNDVGAAEDPSGFYLFGQTEWKDLEGAVLYALGRGAEDVVLIGYSMGGAVVTSFLYQSPMAKEVRAVILDAPMLEFGATVDHGASQRGVPVLGVSIPGAITGIAKALTSLRFGVDFDDLDYLSQAHQLTAPVLLFHGDPDETVPVTTSNALAEARPNLVRYINSPVAGHVRSWNAARTAYEASVESFLRDVLAE